jgi:hypothetical protein
MAGPGLTILESQHKIPTISRDDAFNRLKTNERIKWLIRLIDYDPATQGNLEIGEFPRIGPKEQRFSFVGNYEELRGYHVSDAVRMTGEIMGPRKHVSAVIFELVGNVYPANARGLLQAINKTENHLHTT